MPAYLREAAPSRAALHGQPVPRVVIGLVNNMPDAAIRATERQFLSLLDDASDGIEVVLHRYALPGVPRSDAAWQSALSGYDTIDELYQTGADGVIVTGAEPRTERLIEEPYWAGMTRLVDWAADHTQSAIWSCLAAHVAVLHHDGIERRRHAEKLMGVFEGACSTEGRLLDGLASRWRVPHSRWNSVDRDDLEAHGYRALINSPLAGTDLFAKRNGSLFVYFQSHPEYESQSLLREYIRDVLRFLDGQRTTYPAMPVGYLDAETASEFAALQAGALSHGDARTRATRLGNAAGPRLQNVWHSQAALLYRNWLHEIIEQRSSKRAGQQSAQYKDGMPAGAGAQDALATQGSP